MAWSGARLPAGPRARRSRRASCARNTSRGVWTACSLRRSNMRPRALPSIGTSRKRWPMRGFRWCCSIARSSRIRRADITTSIALDNRRAGALVTSHLLAQGCRRAIFLGLPGAASSVDARAAGFRDAVLQAGLDPTVSQVWREDPADRDRIASLIDVGPSRRLRVRKRSHRSDPDAHAPRAWACGYPMISGWWGSTT